MLPLDLDRRLALTELLAQPDPPDLRRGSRPRLEGKPGRYALVPRLSAAFVQAQLLALEERRAESVDTPLTPKRVETAHETLMNVLPFRRAA